MLFIKKFIPLALMAALLLGAAGCNSNNDQAPANTNEPTQNAAGEQSQTGTQNENPSQPVMSDGVEEWNDTISKDGTTAPTQNQQPTEVPTLPPAGTKLTYAQYLAMTTSQQQEYFKSFDTVDAFYEWLEEAEAEYEKNQNTVTGDGTLDLNDYINSNR